MHARRRWRRRRGRSGTARSSQGSGLRAAVGLGRAERGDVRARAAARAVASPNVIWRSSSVSIVHGSGLMPVSTNSTGSRFSVLRDERVHAGDERRHQPLRLGVIARRARRHRTAPRYLSRRARRSRATACGPSDLRQASFGRAPPHLHLPEPILRHDVALREERVVDRGRRDVGNSPLVAQHLDVAAQAGDLDGRRRSARAPSARDRPATAAAAPSPRRRPRGRSRRRRPAPSSRPGRFSRRRSNSPAAPRLSISSTIASRRRAARRPPSSGGGCRLRA